MSKQSTSQWDFGELFQPAETRKVLSVWELTADIKRLLETKVGSVWVNDIQRSNQRAPFGGMKESGIGREKGRYGVEAYLEYKTIYLSYDARLS